MTDKVGVTLFVNGQRHDISVEPRKTLVDAIRDDCGLTGTHIGCEHGVCGACTVIVDGEPARLIDRRQRQTMSRVDGKSRCREHVGGVGPVLRGVDVGEAFLAGRDAVAGHDGADRARADAGPAVDARRRIDVEHLGDTEIGLFGRGMDAVDRACVDARGVTAARLRYDVWHGAILFGGKGIGALGSGRGVGGLAPEARLPAVDAEDTPQQS